MFTIEPNLFSTFDIGFYTLCLIIAGIYCYLFSSKRGSYHIKITSIILSILIMLIVFVVVMLTMAIFSPYRDLYAFVAKVIVLEIGFAIVYTIYLIDSTTGLTWIRSH